MTVFQSSTGKTSKVSRNLGFFPVAFEKKIEMGGGIERTKLHKIYDTKIFLNPYDIRKEEQTSHRGQVS